MRITININGSLDSDQLERIFISILKKLPREDDIASHEEVLRDSNYNEVGKIWVYTDEWNALEEKII